MAREFPLLTAEQIECRVQKCDKSTGASVLLYKTARTDYEMFDNRFGAMKWQCAYEVINGNLYCKIGVYSDDLKQWVWKENCGTESNTEKEKGEASDALKRAGFAWGCGTELYSAPHIWIPTEKLEWKTVKEKDYLKTVLKLVSIEYNENECISSLTIADQYGNILYTFGKNAKQEATKETPKKETQKKAEPKKEEPKQEPDKVCPVEEKVLNLVCSCCNNPILEFTDNNGKKVSPKRIADSSFKQFGRIMCVGCAAKAKAGLL